MSMRNRVQLIGNTGKDLEVITTESGKKIAKVNLATNEYYINDSGEKITKTEWHKLIFFNKTAEIAENLLKKGSSVTIEGKLTTRNYESKSTEVHYITEIIVDTFILHDKRESVDYKQD